MEKILISACLLGNPVRYDGKGKLIDHPLIQQWQDEGRLISICPEVAGGLPTPRPAAEINTLDGNAVLAKDALVITNDHQDVTQPFIEGAEIALRLAKQHNIKFAILMANSPSCGSSEIYDGTFSGLKKLGDGVTAALLKRNDITVFDQFQIDELARKLSD